jgi:hypothetical protein
MPPELIEQVKDVNIFFGEGYSFIRVQGPRDFSPHLGS